MAKRKVVVGNIALKSAIWLSGRMQRDISFSARISETRFSHIVRGRRVASPKEQARIAKVLALPIAQLFPDVASTPVDAEAEAVTV